MEKNYKLSIIIPTYERGHIAWQTIKNAYALIHNFNCELIIVNDSKKEKITIPDTWKDTTVINNPKQGAASARNFGAKYSKSRYLLFIDDDIIFSSESIHRIIELSENKPDACFNLNWKYTEDQLKIARTTSFGRFILKSKLTDYQNWVPENNWQQNSPFEAEKLAAFFFLIPKQIFLKVGGFDESFLNQGSEDDELCIRLKKEKVRLYIDSSTFVIHNEIDKLNLVNRLNRLKFGAYNRHKAFHLGLNDYQINYNLLKKMIFRMLLKLKLPILSITLRVPNHVIFDFIYFRMTHILIAIYIFEGYHNFSPAGINFNKI